MPSLEQQTGDRLEQLSDKDLEAIAMVIAPEAAEALATGKADNKLLSASKRVDKAIKTEILDRNVTIYKVFTGDASFLKKSGNAVINVFLTGTVKKPSVPKDGVLFRIKVPKGTNALKFPGQAYLLERGLTLSISPGEGSIIDAEVVSERQPEASSTGKIELQLEEQTVKAAGLAVVANDTGRVLMLQRSLDEDGPSAGKWEFPGGKLEDGEPPLEAAQREWMEETGMEIPKGNLGKEGTSPNGKYILFPLFIDTEASMVINLDHEDRPVMNPDDPDGDDIETLAWWIVDDLKGNPALRDEVLNTNWDLLKVESALNITGNIELHLAGEHSQETHGNWAPEVSTDETSGRVTDEDKQIAQRTGLTPQQVISVREAGMDPNDFDASGKPVPGTRSWQQAHGIDESVYNSRPIKRYKGPNDPAIEEFYGDLPPNQKRFARKIAGQEDGIIMNRTAVPGAEEAGFTKITPQIRPDNKVLLDQRTLAKKERELEAAKVRKEQVDNYTTKDLIAERERKVSEAKKNLQEMKTSLPEDIRENARNQQDDAAVKLAKAKKTGDPVKIEAAEADLRRAEYAAKNERKRARLLENDPGRAVSLAEQELKLRETSLNKAKADPEGTLKSVREYSAAQIPRKQEQLEGVRVKYVFPPGEGSASRIEANPDPQNIKNLTQGNGRVYFVMEGNIKSDAVLSRVKKEDPTAAVISVPSVTAWPDAETDFVAQRYLKGRDVILIPDADGVKNPAVVQQSKKLRGKLLNNGVDNVVLAAPPVETNSRGVVSVQKLRYPTGVVDERKGVDDHLGLGRGTLGDLTFNDTPPPKLDVSNIYRQARRNSNSVPNANKTISAISDMAGDSGVGRISHKSIEKYTGLAPSSVNDSVKNLERTGVIKVHHIFDPKSLGHGRRVQAMDESEISKITRKAGVPRPDLTKTYVSDDDNHEVAPIIEIRNPEYITKSGPSKTLASRYKGLQTSADAPKPSVPISRPGIRIVRTAEGARRYGVPIGHPIPEAEEELNTMVTGKIELHLLGQHDQLTHAPVSSRGGGIDAKKIAIALGATAVAAGLVYVAYKKAPGTVRGSEAARRSQNLEAILAKGGKDLDDAIADRTAKIAAGKNVDKNLRDLSVLKNREFLHQDDHAQFIRNLNTNKYSADEIDAMWDYAGIHSARDAKGKMRAFKGPFRFQRALRTRTFDELNDKDQKTLRTFIGAFDRNKLPRSTKLFRGVPATQEEFTRWASLRPGAVIQDRAPMFTGLTHSRARPHYIDDVLPTSNKFQKGRVKSVLFEIDAPEGLPAISSPYGHGLRAGKKLPGVAAQVNLPKWVPGGKKRVVGLPARDKYGIRVPFIDHLNKEELILKPNQKLRLVSSEVNDEGVLIMKVRAEL